MRSTSRLFLRSCAVFFTWAVMATTYGASSVPSYTATDLGPVSYYNVGDEVTLSSSGANGTFTTQSGQVYAFPRTDNLVANPQSLLDTFPPFTNAPIGANGTNGDPNSVYSHFSTTDGVFLNKTGVFVATDLLGVNGDLNPGSGVGSIVDTATRQLNGTFGPLTALWHSPENQSSGGQVAMALDLNNTGLVLGITEPRNQPYGSRDFFLYNLNTGVSTDLASLLPTGWYPDIPKMALDDQGRILLTAIPPLAFSGADNPDHLFLLTPAGLSSSPLATPEPTPFVTLAVVGIGLAGRRRWKS